MPIKSNFKIIFFTALLALSCTPILFAQDFLIKKYSVDNGLPDNRVNDIVQDSTGRIWIATKTGIASYDGVEWTKYDEKDGVPEIEHIRIKIDEKGIIWFLPRLWFNNSIIYYEKSKWYKLDIKISYSNKSIMFFSFDVKNSDNNLELCIGTLTNGLLRYLNNEWESVTRKQGILSDTVTNVLFSDDELYVSSLKGLTLIKEEQAISNFTAKELGIDSKILSMNVSNFSGTKKNKLLLLGQNWLGEFINQKINILNRDFNIPFVGINDFNSINSNPEGDVFFGNPARVFHFNYRTGKSTQIIIEDPSSNKSVNSIMIDYEKNIWFAGFRGVYQYRFSAFKNYTKADGLLEDEVSAISEFNSGQIVLGHNYGISIQTESGFRTVNFRKPIEDTRLVRVLDIFHDSKKDEIYFCSYTNGLGKLSSNLKLKWIKGQDYLRYFSLIGKGQEEIIITTDQGLIVYNHGGKFHGVYPNMDISSLIRKGIVISNNLIYFASTRGLIKWYKNYFSIIRIADISANDLYSLFHNQKYGLLVGSVKGLYALKQDSLVKFSFNERDISESIYFIIEDKKQNIWLGTNNGVLKWDGNKLVRFNKSDGLAGNETNRAAGFVDSKGNVWIGTDEGLSMYTGAELDYTDIKPKILLLNIQDAHNNHYPINSELVFAPSNNSLTFNYRGLSFIDESRNIYQVKLKKINGSWSEQYETNYPYSKFNNLSPGDYIFSVRFKNAKGIWSDWKKSSIITINKHFYQQPVFIISVFIIFIFVLYYVYEYLQQKKYAKKLENAVETKTQELRKNQVELMTSLQRYKGIVDSQSDLVIRVDAEGNFSFVNDAFCKVFGKTREELLGTSLFNYIYPDDIPAAVEEAKKLNLPPYRVKLELRSITRNGLRWFSWEDYAFFDENKNLYEVQGVGRDITVQKEIEEELERRVRERTAELKSLIEQSPLGIITFDEEGYLIDYNDSANKMFGDLSKYLPPDRSFNIFKDEFLEKNNYQSRLNDLHSPNSQLITGRIFIDNSKNYIYHNLYSNYLIYRLYSVGFDNNKIMIVLLIENVTDLQKSEESSKKLSEEKLRITTIIKTIEAERERISKELHDGVGQMLTATKLKLDIFNLKTENDKTEIDESIKLLLNAGEEIRRIINDLKPSDVENFGLITSIETVCQRLKQISGIDIRFSANNSVQLKNKSDEVIVYRIIQEALNNIIKHSKCKNAGIDISNDTNFIVIKIWDDGVGIPDEFNQKKSFGFGIQNMKSRAKSIGAFIDIQSSDTGTIITLKIPIQ
jgi:PAS domain S-box-containing protein